MTGLMAKIRSLFKKQGEGDKPSQPADEQKPEPQKESAQPEKTNG